MKKKKLKRRLDAIEDLLTTIEERQLTIATTLAPLAYDLRQGGWHIPTPAHAPEADGITEMVRKMQ